MKNKKVGIRLYVECPRTVKTVCLIDCCECEHYVSTDKNYDWVECSYEYKEGDE